MRKLAVLVAVAAASVSAASCSTFFAGPDTQVVSPYRNVGMNPRGRATRGPATLVSIDLPRMIAQYVGGHQGDTLEISIARFDSVASRYPRDPRFAGFRNSIVGAVLIASDRNCAAYMENLRGNQVLVRGLGSSLATLFSNAAPLITPKANSDIASVIGGVSSGVSGNINDAVFGQRTADVIAAGVRADRGPRRIELEEKIRDHADSYFEWPLSQAIADVTEYHGRCNVVNGLNYVQTATKKQGEEDKAKLQGGGPNGGPTAQPSPTPPVTGRSSLRSR